MATPYHILIAPAAYRQIQVLTPKTQRCVVKLLDSLAINPRPPVARKIDGLTGLYCEDADNTHIVYKIDDQEVLILLVKQI